MSEVRVPAQIDYGEGSFPGCGPLISYIFTWQRAETGSMISCGFYRALIPCMKGTPPWPWPHLILITSQGFHVLTWSHCMGGGSKYVFERSCKYLVHNRMWIKNFDSNCQLSSQRQRQSWFKVLLPRSYYFSYHMEIDHFRASSWDGKHAAGRSD